MGATDDGEEGCRNNIGSELLPRLRDERGRLGQVALRLLLRIITCYSVRGSEQVSTAAKEVYWVSVNSPRSVRISDLRERGVGENYHHRIEHNTRLNRRVI